MSSYVCVHREPILRPVLRNELVNDHDAESSSNLLSMIVDREPVSVLPLPSSQWSCAEIQQAPSDRSDHTQWDLAFRDSPGNINSNASNQYGDDVDYQRRDCVLCHVSKQCGITEAFVLLSRET
jgi:hypothetical protein